MTPNPQPQTLSLARALALPYFLHKRQESRMDPLSPSRAISNEPRRCRRLNVSPCSNGNGNGNGGTLQLSSSAPTRTMAAPATTRLLTNNFALSPANPRAIRRRSTATATATATSGLTEVLSPLELPVLDTSSASMRRLARELTEGQRMRSRRSIVDTRYSEEHKQESLLGKDYDDDHEEGSGNGNHCDQVDSSEDLELLLPPLKLTKTQQQQQQPHDSTSSYGSFSKTEQDKKSNQQLSFVETMIQQISAVAVVALLNMMIAIPFGASYFPIGWKAADDDLSGPSDDETPEDLDGTFPLQGKQALGIRMFLFATLIGQLAFTFGSKFNNPVGCQMVENVPFLHALCHVAIQRQGYGMEALSTVFFLFGLSSVVVGWTFYLLGKYELGKIVYFFPNHVLVGCIGGIGVFILITAVEVTNNATFEFSEKGWASLLEDFHLLAIVLGFECTLRFLIWWTQDSQGRPKYPLLSPIYYCMITPLFYLGLWILGISLNRASELGYFFSETSSENIGLADPHLWDMFQITNLSNISWMAVVESTGTMIALAAFSLIHVPINIPAFAISTDVDTDMNAELIAHGYANALSGVFGGLQNYMTYSNSVLYAKTGGKGKISSFAIVFLTMILFVIGPSIASYLPRCMAGTLLLHIGIDLILEGVYDSFGNYDHIEYAGIWIIGIVMTIWGMTGGLIAGVIAALSTYAVQSINYQNPIRQILTASTLRSSAWARCSSARTILENDTTGRSRILIFQLQGHLFFGNVAQLTDTIKDVLKEKKEEGESPMIVIIDFTLVVGMDSSAAHAVAKLKKIFHRLFHVEVSIFVTGSDRGGFPCEFALSQALSPDVRPSHAAAAASDRVCESLDDALKFAEDILISRVDPSLGISNAAGCIHQDKYCASSNMSIDEEKSLARSFLIGLLLSPEDVDPRNSIDVLISLMQREEYKKGQSLWEQGCDSDSAKLLIYGELSSIIEDTGAPELVRSGNIVGELGLVHGTKRLTTLICSTEKAILYNLSKESWEKLNQENLQAATLMQGVVIRYLAHRVQHVSNRYFHTTLPV